VRVAETDINQGSQRQGKHGIPGKVREFYCSGEVNEKSGNFEFFEEKSGNFVLIQEINSKSVKIDKCGN